MESKATAIRTIKQEVRLQEWSAQIEVRAAYLNTDFISTKISVI